MGITNNMASNTNLNMTSCILSTRKLGKTVPTANGELHILSAIELDIKRGETVAVVGVSGSGKSTLLGLLAGLDLPTEGYVRLDDENLNELDEDGRARLRGRLVGFVFQSFQLMPGFTALENVMLPLELAAVSDPATQAGKLLKRVGLAERMHHYPKQLSGGEQQRVAIARAFSVAPAILFADEPTGNLDADTGETIIELLFELNREQGTTLVLVTHDEQLAGRCERRLHLHAGCLLD
jgi:putative ABC transport system ATP-binding protein